MLNDRQALNLFSLNAFKRNRPPSDYLKLAQRAVRYAQGHPLALIVLGSHLFRRSREEWEATFDSCRGEDPHREIRDVLKISFDALGVDLKGYFLDIACFFKGEHVDRVKPILEACYDLKSVTSITQLQEKALIRIDRDRIWMHDLIEEMGKDIVYQESPGEPGKRSRVWSEEDINHVLTNNTGTIKVIGVQVSWRSSLISLNAKTFSKMKNLRYISMGMYQRYESFSGNIDYLSHQLRDNFSSLTSMDLRGCKSLIELPNFTGIPNLIELKLDDCESLVEVHHSVGFLDKLNFSRLTCMNLSGCTSLTELPDLSGIPNLKELDLSWCSSLVEVPDSVGLLDKLVTLNVDHCSNLIKFPRKINLKSVKTISISFCKLEEFSEVGEEMGSLRKLDLSGTCIKELHPSITRLIGLEELKLRNCKNLTFLPYNIYELHNLKSLEAIGCSKLATFPKILVKMYSLRRLSLKGSDIRELDESIENLIGLEELDLTDCKNLATLPCSIYGLHNLKLYARECSQLATFPKIPVKMDSLRRLSLKGSDIRELDESIENLIGLEELDLSYCENLSTLTCSIYELHNLKTLDASGCSKMATFPKIPVKMDSLRLLSLKGSDIRELDESIENLIGLEYLDLTECENLTTLPCSIYGLQNLWFLDLGECSKLVRFPTNTKILNIDGCSLSLPKLGVFSIAGCNLLSDCDFLMTLDCWETLQWLNLSRNNFVSLPACFTKFVKLRELDLMNCKRLREIPELPPNVKPETWGCESLEERFSTLTNRGAAGGQASMVHFAHEMAISPIPMIPDLQIHHSGWLHWHLWLSSAKDDYHHQQEQQEHPISPQLPSLN
ncbi:hypothetical protein ABKV19_017224 [Rosa sericea]